MECTIRIPEPTKHFSVYANAVTLSVIRMEKESFVTFDSDYTAAIYYKVHGHRTLYLCVHPEKAPEFPSVLLPGISSPLSVIMTLTGRSYDRYKRTTKILHAVLPDTKKLPLLFFIQLAGLCKAGNVTHLSLASLLLSYGKKLPKLEKRKRRTAS